MREKVANHCPKWVMRLVRLLVKPHFLEEVEGDLEERFQDNLEQYGSRKARFLFVLEAFKTLRPALLKNPGGDLRLNNYGMFKNYLKVAWRQLRKQRIFSLIKIGGFSIGIAACILITLYINHQTSYDQHYENHDRIYRMVNQWSEAGETGYWSNVHGPLKPVLEDNIPEMEKVARVVLWSWGDAGQNHMRKVESPYNHYENGFIYADPDLLSILEIPMSYGTTAALRQPNSVVIAESIAEKYFKDENPLGKQIILNERAESTFTITGVMEDFPENSHLAANFILTLFERKNGPGTAGWCCTNYNIYTRLTPDANKEAVEAKTAELRNTYVIDQLRKDGQTQIEEMQQYQSYYLQPINNVYLNPEGVHDNLPHGSQDVIWIFGVVAVIILLLACVNFINLTTAKATSRAREVGLRKVVGSVRSSLIYQYLIESCLNTFLAILLGSLIAWAAMPFFNQLANTDLVIPWGTNWFIPLLLISSILIGVLAGSYPAFYLSSFRPAVILHSHAIRSKSASFFKNGMIVFQFIAAMMLVVCALVTRSQFDYLMNKPIGFDKEQVINIKGLGTMSQSERMSLKEELTQLSEVQNASLSDYLPVEGGALQNRSFWLASRRQLDPGFEAARWLVDEDYIQTMSMDIMTGRDFDPKRREENSVIINQKMAEELGIENPLGQQVIDMFDEKYTIIGVVKDFYFESMVEEVRPLAMHYGKRANTMSVRIKSKDTKQAVASIEDKWSEFKPNQSIRYEFMNRQFQKMYEELERVKTIFLLFSALVIVIGCMGLFALSIYMTDQRAKEVSIRKVMGASMKNIFVLLSSEFVKLIVISLVIAIPLSWYVMERLLEDMANRISLNWMFFFAAAMLTLIVALSTVSWEIIKVARSNPAKRLKNE